MNRAMKSTSGWACSFFITFQVVAVWMISHLFVGIVLEAFMKVRVQLEEQRAEQQQLEEDEIAQVVLNDDVFDDPIYSTCNNNNNNDDNDINMTRHRSTASLKMFAVAALSKLPSIKRRESSAQRLQRQSQVGSSRESSDVNNNNNNTTTDADVSLATRSRDGSIKGSVSGGSARDIPLTQRKLMKKPKKLGNERQTMRLMYRESSQPKRELLLLLLLCI